MTKVLCPECGLINSNSNLSCTNCTSSLNLKNKYFLLKILDKRDVITYLACEDTFNTSEEAESKKLVIKEFSLTSAKEWNAHDLFKKEGNILAQLNSPSIPKFIEDFDIGFGDNSKSYIVMEYIDGISLKDEQEKKRYTEKEAIDDILKIAKTLDYLHNLIPPIIHQDLNLSNIMRRKDGSLVLIDFNAVKDKIIKSVGDDVLGTYGFIAPEQLQGKAVTASDYYSLGVVILVLLTKKQPEEMFNENDELNWKSSLNTSDKITYLLENLLLKDPIQRISTFKEIETILVAKNKASNNKVSNNIKKIKASSSIKNEKKSSIKIEISDNAKIIIGKNVKIQIGSNYLDEELNLERLKKSAQKAKQRKKLVKKIEKNKEIEHIAVLKVLSGMKVKNFFMTKTISSLGRAESKNDIAINHGSISRKHCKITKISSNSFKITDFDSMDVIHINNKRALPSAKFAHGDILKIGNIVFRFLVNGCEGYEGYEGYQKLIKPEVTRFEINELEIMKKRKRNQFLYLAILVASIIVFLYIKT